MNILGRRRGVTEARFPDTYVVLISRAAATIDVDVQSRASFDFLYTSRCGSPGDKDSSRKAGHHDSTIIPRHHKIQISRLTSAAKSRGDWRNDSRLMRSDIAVACHQAAPGYGKIFR